MPDEYERLRKQIEDGVHAAEELKKLLAQSKPERHRKPKLKLIKGGILGGAVWAGVEWFRDYRRVAAALAAAGITIAGVAIAEHPGSPGADPPPTTVKPAKPKPSPHPRAVATPTPTLIPTTPPRTSPLRTLGTRVIKATPAPSTTSPSSTTPSPSTSPTKPPTATPTILATPTAIRVTPSVTPPVTVRPDINTTCPGVASDLIEVKLCLPLER